MKIGLYHQRTGTVKSGGTETTIRSFARELAKRHDVTLYTQTGELLDEVASMNIEVVQIPALKKDSFGVETLRKTPVKAAELGSLSMFVSAKKRGVLSHIEENLDVLSTHYYLDNILLSNTVDIPTIFRFPGIHRPAVRWKAMFRLAYPDLYLVSSKSTQNRITRWFGRSPEIVYNGIDIDRFSPDADPSFSHDDSVVLYVGRVEEGKGIPDLIRAMSDVPAHLRIVGDGRYLDKCRRIASKELSDYEFVGEVDHEKIHREYAGADIFCLPSYNEGFPYVVLEAMASGLPVVATDLEGIRETVTDGENGVLIEPGDVPELKDTLMRLMSSPDLREKFGMNARNTAINYSIESCARRMEEIYKKVVQ